VSSSIVIRSAEPDEVIDLRHTVLRAGLPRETAIFAGDDDPQARHFVATINERIVGCVTLLLNAWENEPAWQLRGMAVEPEIQRGGIGRRLLQACEESVLASPTHLLWCNAREPASGFYAKHGWRRVSEVFEFPTAGPHVKMLKRLEPGVR
jgi:predicted GNAT family N-acyltransferase